MRLSPFLSMLLIAASPAAAQNFSCDQSVSGDGWSFNAVIYFEGTQPVGSLATLTVDGDVAVAEGAGLQPDVAAERSSQPLRGRLVVEVGEEPGGMTEVAAMVQIVMPAFVAAPGAGPTPAFRLALGGNGTTLISTDAPQLLARPADLDTPVDRVYAHLVGASNNVLARLGSPEARAAATTAARAIIQDSASSQVDLIALPADGSEIPVATMAISSETLQTVRQSARPLLDAAKAQRAAGGCRAG